MVWDMRLRLGSTALSVIPLALPETTKLSASRLQNPDDYFALKQWLDEQFEDERAGSTLSDFVSFIYTGGTIQEHINSFTDLLHSLESLSKPPQRCLSRTARGGVSRPAICAAQWHTRICW
jgi:hypothetical protein